MQVVAERYYGCPVEVTAAVEDEGQDLLIHHPKGLIVAEFKHYRTSRVGRPVVQKVHSAVVTAGSTHGRFEAGAVAALAVRVLFILVVLIYIAGDAIHD